jgi:2-polyprenyl-3-methyl-5-hydroxy-6-metoxy-1,4-benzoquinol methylase
MTITSQRTLYSRGGITKWYWDFRDRQVISRIPRGVSSILDIGCGEGITLEKVMREFPGRRVWGVEVCPNPPTLPIMSDSVYHLRNHADSWDCVLLLDVIEHLERPRDALYNINRILSPGGTLLLLFPNDRTFKYARILTGKWRAAFTDRGHVNTFTPVSMIKMLSDCGFAVDGFHYLPFDHWLARWSLSLHFLVTARKRICTKTHSY